MPVVSRQSVYAAQDPYSKTFMPEPVYANIGKLLLSLQIYDMHRLAHEVSGGLIVALPGPDEDHNPETAATLAEVFRANPTFLTTSASGVPLYRGSHGFLSRGLVLAHQSARRWFAGGTEAGDLAQLSGRRQGGTGRAIDGAGACWRRTTAQSAGTNSRSLL